MKKVNAALALIGSSCMRRTPRLLCLVALLLGISSALAAADGGVTDGTRIPIRQDGTQRVRVHYVDDARCLRVLAAGVATRNAPPAPPTTEGVINLPVDLDPGSVVWGGLYWEILGPDVPAALVSLNGTVVTVVPLPVGPPPCFPLTIASHPYFADVTGLVVAGDNVIDGLADSGPPPDYGYQAEGASLVVIYESEISRACEIIVMDGNDLLSEITFIENPMPVSCGDGESATVIFVGGDGQDFAVDNQLWNGVALGDGDDFDCSDPRMPGAAPVGWDTDAWVVTTGGGNRGGVSAPENVPTWDCVNWIATVLEVDVQACGATPTQKTSWGALRALYR